jgi:flagellar basal body-associated protein FliL
MINTPQIISMIIAILACIGLFTCAVGAISSYFYNRNKNHDRRQYLHDTFLLAKITKSEFMEDPKFIELIEEANEEFHSIND